MSGREIILVIILCPSRGKGPWCIPSWSFAWDAGESRLQRAVPGRTREVLRGLESGRLSELGNRESASDGPCKHLEEALQAQARRGKKKMSQRDKVGRIQKCHFTSCGELLGIWGGGMVPRDGLGRRLLQGKAEASKSPKPGLPSPPPAMRSSLTFQQLGFSSVRGGQYLPDSVVMRIQLRQINAKLPGLALTHNKLH